MYHVYPLYLATYPPMYILLYTTRETSVPVYSDLYRYTEHTDNAY